MSKHMLSNYQVRSHFLFSFQDFGFHNKTVIRILIARSEIDLMNIRQRYKERYGKSLFHDIKVSFDKLLHIFSTGITQTVPLCLTVWFKTKQRKKARCKNNSTFSVPQFDLSK